MNPCVFSAIIAGELPANIVADTPDGVAFLDKRPVFPGHTLVVPREHVETLSDLPAALLPGYFALVQRIAGRMAALVPPGTEVLAGLEIGGIAVVTALGRHTGLPCAFVRKQAKQYGTARLAEGAEVSGRRVLVVEDVVTSGGQIAVSTEQLRDLGAKIDAAICVIDRAEGGAAALAAVGIALHALFTRADLDAA